MIGRYYILAYHMISESPNGFFPEESLADFARQVEYLKKNYNVLSLEEMVKRTSEGKSVGGCAAITFDDGFRDNYLRAYPILKEYQIPATVFLATGFIENGETPWFIKFRYLFMRTTRTRLEIELGGKTTGFSLAGFPEKRAASDTIMVHLQTCGDDERLDILDMLPSLLDVDPTSQLPSMMLTWDQITEMSQNGIHFGAHTVTHPILSNVSPEVMRSEIENSKYAIERRTGRSVKTFAYPFGRKRHYPPNAATVLKDLGFTCAVTTERGSNAAGTPIFELRRSHPWELLFA